MIPLSTWITAARPKTLPASIIPVLAGTTLAFVCQGHINPILFCFTLLTGLGIQISTNFVNDYFDCIRGADTAERKGPLRITQAGLVSLPVMRRAMTLCLILTALSGIYLIFEGGMSIAVLVVLSLLLAICYTAGPYPIAYLGLGDLFVWVFFGPVATAGSCFLQTGSICYEAVIIGSGLGAISAAVLCVNNIRDAKEDAKAQKKTTVVRFGIFFGKIQYLTCLGIATACSLSLISVKPLSILSLLFLLPGISCINTVFGYKHPSELNPLLGKTGKLLIWYGTGAMIGFLIP